MKNDKPPVSTAPNRIPQPPTRPILGNLGDIDTKAPVQSMMRLAAEHGPIFRLTLAGRSFYVVSSQALVDELCDESRFVKRLHAPLLQIRAFAGDGLFTAHNSEPNWGKAHRLLMPAFGPVGVRGMFDRMVDVAHQMFEKWERFGPSAVIDVADNMTRLTLDTIALCAFDYRFNSFYQNEMHPFVAAMVDALDEAGQRTRRPEVVTQLKLGAKRRYEASQALLAKVAEELIAERRADPDGAAKSDLLNVMLNGVDPVTGEKLSDENIRFQMVTFLIAGHETTSGLLSFACYLLLKNPEAMVRAQALCDEVMGHETPRLEHLAKLRFLEQILMESLRLWPTAPAFAVKPVEATMLAGRYAVTPDDTLLILEPMLHRDPAVWGDDAEAFRPERFEPDVAAGLPPNAWKPFGNGARACIGRAFAMQEAQLVLAMLLQRFDIVMADPSYQLQIAETLTLKPHGLEIRARRRGSSRFALSTAPAPAPRQLRADAPEQAPALPADAPRLLVLYGSNTGSCEMFARRIAADAARHGFAATAGPMDEHAAAPATGTTLVVVTASYEGQAPDNARRFVSWLEACPAGTLAGTLVCVFGCGNRQWARTYQQVPKRVDAALAAAGGTALRPRGEADAGGDFFGAFDAWYAGFWHDLDTALGRARPATAELAAAPPLEVEVLRSGRQTALQLGELDTGTVVERRELVDMAKPGARSKLHLQVALPDGMRYRSGDYLSVLPRNHDAAVGRALRRFGLAGDTQILIHKQAGVATTLPAGYPVGAAEVLGGYVELGQPATRAQVGQLADATPCPPEQQRLRRLAEEPTYAAEVLGGRLSVLDLLDEAHSCSLPFAGFLAMLPPMRARQYSISSSPLVDPTQASLTLAVVDAPALSGRGRFSGVASGYLARLNAGDRFPVAVRPSQSGFHPPADPRTPIVMVCAGTGVAPFRGFLQERAAQQAAGRDVGRALLFFGVDHPEVDFLYREEFAAWAACGVVDLRMAFSALPQDGVVFVQDRVWQDRADISAMFRDGAQFFVCGDGRHMAPAVRETFVRIYKTAAQADDAAAEAWVNRMEHEHGRYVSDVFA